MHEKSLSFWLDDASKTITLADGATLTITRFDDNWISAIVSGRHAMPSHPPSAAAFARRCLRRRERRLFMGHPTKPRRRAICELNDGCETFWCARAAA
jgi:hypothetical protein